MDWGCRFWLGKVVELQRLIGCSLRRSCTTPNTANWWANNLRLPRLDISLPARQIRSLHALDMAGLPPNAPVPLLEVGAHDIASNGPALAKASDDKGDILGHVQKIWDGIRPNSTIYRLFLSELQWISAAHGRIVARLRLQPVHLNSKGTLHGSVSATIVDWAGGMAIASTGLHKTGVSTDIHISYVSAAKDNDLIEIEAWVTRVGKSLAYTMVEIRKVGPDLDGKGPVVCTGSHTKYRPV